MHTYFPFTFLTTFFFFKENIFLHFKLCHIYEGRRSPHGKHSDASPGPTLVRGQTSDQKNIATFFLREEVSVLGKRKQSGRLYIITAISKKLFGEVENLSVLSFLLSAISLKKQNIFKQTATRNELG